MLLSASVAPAIISAIGNPASIFCSDNGGTLEIRSKDAGEYGVCMFGDGSECGEWAYFRGECSVGDSLASPLETVHITHCGYECGAVNGCREDNANGVGPSEGVFGVACSCPGGVESTPACTLKDGTKAYYCNKLRER